MSGKVKEELKKNFRPEFLNRVDEVIVFPHLTHAELLLVVDLFVKRLRDRLYERDMSIEVSFPAKERLAEIGWDPTLGARPLRRAVQREVEDAMSERILYGEFKAGDHIKVDFVDGEFTFTAAPRDSAAPSAEPVPAEA